MKLLFTLSLFFTASQCFAQRQNVYFLKNNGKYVTVRDSADYIRIVRAPDSASVLYNVFEFYLNGNKKLIGKSTAIDPPKYDGSCATYYPDGKREAVINYKNGSKTGNDMEFYPNGKLYLEITYPDKNIPGVDYLIKTNNDTLGNALVTDGNGYYKGYNDKFTYIEEEGNVKNGKRDGQWKGDYKNTHITFTENYDNGQFVSGNAIAEDGKSVTYTKSRRVPPQFKSGIEGFGRYLSHNIKYPDYARARNIQGQVILSFVVEKNGDLTDIIISKPVSPVLDEEAIRVLKNSPKWLPGMQFGMPARVRYSVPITFKMN